MPNNNIHIIDYGMGNLHSVRRKFESLGVEVLVARNPKELEGAEKLILPGVGHFGKAMENLNNLGLIPVLNELVLEKKIPVLGICLGMQLMADSSEEGAAHGLGWISGQVKKLQVEDTLAYKIPHTGWNSIEITQDHPVLSGIANHSLFYFVHSYHFNPSHEANVLTRTTYENTFVSAVVNDNIIGVQFHPEKSHDVGRKLLSNFISL